MRKEALHGIWAGLPVPWSENNTFDETAFRKDIRACIEVGVHGIYTGGTTGEFFAQSESEFQAIAKVLIEETQDKDCPIQIGCTSLSTGELFKKMEYAVSLGAKAVQLAIPFWLPMSDEEIIDFFGDLYSSFPDTSLVIYHNLHAKREFTVELLRQIIDTAPSLIGLKHNCFSLENTRLFVERLPELNILVGENNLFDCLKFGASGCHSALVMLNPHLMLQLYDLCVNGDFEKSSIINDKIQKLFEGFALLSKKGYRPHAIDRCLGKINGFLQASLKVRKPFKSVDDGDFLLFKEWIKKNVPEFMKMGPML